MEVWSIIATVHFYFQLDIFVNGTFFFTEVPRVVIPLDMSMCHNTTPPSNHTHMGRSTDPLIDACAITPHLAAATADAIGDTVTCTSSTRPNCRMVTCRVNSNNVNMTYTLLPCHTPPAVQITNVLTNGSASFNRTFTNTTKSVSAHILGWENPAMLNITIVQHPEGLTMGLAVSNKKSNPFFLLKWIFCCSQIDVQGGNDVKPTRIVPYSEIPIPICSKCEQSGEQSSWNSILLIQ